MMHVLQAHCFNNPSMMLYIRKIFYLDQYLSHILKYILNIFDPNFLFHFSMTVIESPLEVVRLFKIIQVILQSHIGPFVKPFYETF